MGTNYHKAYKDFVPEKTQHGLTPGKSDNGRQWQYRGSAALLMDFCALYNKQGYDVYKISKPPYKASVLCIATKDDKSVYLLVRGNGVKKYIDANIPVKNIEYPIDLIDATIIHRDIYGEMLKLPDDKLISEPDGAISILLKDKLVKKSYLEFKSSKINKDGGLDGNATIERLEYQMSEVKFLNLNHGSGGIDMGYCAFTNGAEKVDPTQRYYNHLLCNDKIYDWFTYIFDPENMEVWLNNFDEAV